MCPINAVFQTAAELHVQTDDVGNVVLSQGANTITFPPELAERVLSAVLEASKGDR